MEKLYIAWRNSSDVTVGFCGGYVVGYGDIVLLFINIVNVVS